jgi:hypothetical protein
MSEPNNVKRYDLVEVGNAWLRHMAMREDPDGDWVSYEEYEKLRIENAYLKDILRLYRRPGRY